MAISIVIMAAAIFVLAYTAWMVRRQARSQSWRSQQVTQMVGVIALGELINRLHLTVTWDIDHLFQYFWLAIVLCALIAPVLRKTEEDIGKKTPSLLD
jgi:hypothetical protein